MLKVKNLSLVKSRPILQNISFSVATGRITLLLGKSGSGKTSLLRCLAHLEKDYAGAITYQDQSLRAIDQRMRSQIIGYVAQSYSLFPHLTVLDNCAQPLRLLTSQPLSALLPQIEKTLQSLDMLAYTCSRPHELSGGQQQRIAITRALLLNPSFLLLDEPTSALDPTNTELLIQILLTLRSSGKGLIISTQDMTFASKLLDHALFLENGSIVETYDTTLSVELPERLVHFLYGKVGC